MMFPPIRRSGSNGAPRTADILRDKEYFESLKNGWLSAFKIRNGRPLRILHVGNIANNAYLNAKMLRKIGVEADVLCHDYYHIMGCPEWEDAELSGHWGNDSVPDWNAAGIGDYKRPEWFYQGPLAACGTLIVGTPAEKKLTASLLSLIPAKLQPMTGFVSRTFQAARFYADVTGPLRLIVAFLIWPFIFADRAGRAIAHRVLPRPIRQPIGRVYSRMLRILFALLRRTGEAFSAARQAVRATTRRLRAILTGRERKPSTDRGRHRDDSSPTDLLIENFARRFPERAPLSRSDLLPYLPASRTFADIFDRYDIVHCYGLSPIDALLAGKRPYVAFEHGTIRDIPFHDDPAGKLSALGYREADHTFITNCDNILAANRLGLSNYSFIPHPVNEEGTEPDTHAAALRAQIEKEYGTDFILFHPPRQHWEAERHPNWEKGNDFLIRGFAAFVKAANPRALAIFVEWGRTVAESKALIAELGIADRVIWIPPQPNRAMIRYVLASDVVADQFYLGAFGSLTPKAMMCGRPVLLHLDEKLHEWAFPEMPPVENVQSPESIAAALSRLYLDPGYRTRRGEECKSWYEKYHSSRRILTDLLSVYREALARTPLAAADRHT